MDLQLIKTFVEVAESGSFAAASERLFVTQSAVSLRVQRLEDRLGQELFTRSSEGVSLTAAGRLFQPHAAALLHHWKAARSVMAAGEGASQLSLFVPPAFGSELLPAWLQALAVAKPDLKVEQTLAEADVMLLPTGRVKSGYHALEIAEIELVHLGPASAPTSGPVRYIHLNWGEDFNEWHASQGADLQAPALRLEDPAIALDLLRKGGWSAYLPAKYSTQELQVQKGAQKYPLRLWAYWRDTIGEELRDVAQTTLSQALKH